MRHVHRIKKEAEQEAQQPKPELRQGELALEGGRADTVTRDTAGMQSSDRDAASAQYFDTVPPGEAEDYPWAHAAAAQEDVPPPDRIPPSRTGMRLTKPCGGTGASSSNASGKPGSRYSTPRDTRP